MTPALSSSGNVPVANRWWRLTAGVIAMMAIANLQYAWTLFTIPLTKELGVKLSGAPPGVAGPSSNS